MNPARAPQPYRLELELRGLPRLQPNERWHWAARYRHDKRWREWVGRSARHAGLPARPLERAVIECTRYSVRACDVDNCFASWKPLLDGLKRVVIVDDSPDHVTVLSRWERCASRKEQRVRIVVEEAL